MNSPSEIDSEVGGRHRAASRRHTRAGLAVPRGRRRQGVGDPRSRHPHVAAGDSSVRRSGAARRTDITRDHLPRLRRRTRSHRRPTSVSESGAIWPMRSLMPDRTVRRRCTSWRGRWARGSRSSCCAASRRAFDRLALVAPATNWRRIIRHGVKRAGLPGFLAPIVTWALGSPVASRMIGMPAPLRLRPTRLEPGGAAQRPDARRCTPRATRRSRSNSRRSSRQRIRT